MDGTLVVAGALTGFVVGLTGVGGGALMTPVLLLFFGVTPLVAIGSDLWFAAITKLVASRVHQRRGLIDWSVVKYLWLGSLPASGLTLAYVLRLPVGESTSSSLRKAVALMVCLSAIAMLLQPQLHLLGRRWNDASTSRCEHLQKPLTVLAGVLLGVLVTLTSVGAGALGAVLLLYLYPFRLTPPRLIATDIAHAIPLAMLAGFGQLLAGNVSLTLLGNLLTGSVPAVLIGSILSARLPHAILRVLLASVLLVIGFRLT